MRTTLLCFSRLKEGVRALCVALAFLLLLAPCASAPFFSQASSRVFWDKVWLYAVCWYLPFVLAHGVLRWGWPRDRLQCAGGVGVVNLCLSLGLVLSNRHWARGMETPAFWMSAGLYLFPIVVAMGWMGIRRVWVGRKGS